jgi:hypothetical protein
VTGSPYHPRTLGVWVKGTPEAGKEETSKTSSNKQHQPLISYCYKKSNYLRKPALNKLGLLNLEKAPACGMKGPSPLEQLRLKEEHE